MGIWGVLCLQEAEIIDFDRQAAVFAAANALVLGASTYSEYVHMGWRQQHPGLRQLHIPLLADTLKSLATAMGILDGVERVAYRATFIIDPENTVRDVSLYDMRTGRNVDEVLRVLQALQTTALTPCGWQPGEATIGDVH
ncbi:MULTISPECIES: redoxin domain-containing protein [Chitinophaga]|uniref:redoxin domain-containing protein n=1 Tax=Chitinophaga TaxID=79328 RepID=UPI001CECABE6|nr:MULTISPECIES: redoxin domain-containing protein [Chitinophaga]